MYTLYSQLALHSWGMIRIKRLDGCSLATPSNSPHAVSVRRSSRQDTQTPAPIALEAGKNIRWSYNYTRPIQHLQNK